jgi:hypothetical protein
MANRKAGMDAKFKSKTHVHEPLWALLASKFPKSATNCKELFPKNSAGALQNAEFEAEF